MLKQELINIHDSLMNVEVKGENTLILGDSIYRLRMLIGSLPDEPDRTASTDGDQPV